MMISVNFVVRGSFGSGFWLSDDVREVLSGICCWNLDREIFCIAYLIARVEIYVLPVPVVWIHVLRTSFAVSTVTFVVCGLTVIAGGVLLVIWWCGGEDFTTLLLMIRGGTAVTNVSIYCV